MKYSALIGNPTEHSVSPMLFEWIASRLARPVEYKHLKIDVARNADLESTIEACKTLGFCGLNVTLPYKQAIIPYLDKIDDSISSIGAVNTIVLNDESKQSIGYNTDWYGIYMPLSKVLGSRTAHAIIFGTGGASRAAIHACLELGFPTITVLHRVEESDRTRSLQNQFSDKVTIDFDTYEKIGKYISDAGVIINTTSAGMVGQDAATPFSLNLLSESKSFANKIFFDCVFNPVETPLLTYFKSNGATTVDGLWMMIHQGLYAFTLWTGHDVRDTFTENDLNDLHILLQRKVEHV